MISFDTLSTSSLPISANLKEFKFFSEKAIYFSKKDILRNHYFSRILRKICYNFEMRIFRGQKMSIQFGHYQLASQRIKNVRFEWMIFLQYYNYGGKKTTKSHFILD